MTNSIADESSHADASGEAPALSNTDRLRSHLKSDSLASALLEAWDTGGQDDAKARLLQAIENHFSKKKPENAEALHPED